LRSRAPRPEAVAAEYRLLDALCAIDTLNRRSRRDLASVAPIQHVDGTLTGATGLVF
jgi:hypothetical protein